MQFQIHVTTGPMSPQRKAQFLTLCHRYKVKPLLIVLDEGETIDQPMFTYLTEQDTIEEALIQLRPIKMAFDDAAFPIKRIKCEINPDDKTDAIKGLYYEWHCKVNPYDPERLSALCAENDAHLSRNSLVEGEKYITIRKENKDDFTAAVRNLKNLLPEWPLDVLKEKYEYCVSDSCLALDDGWTNKKEQQDFLLFKIKVYETILKIISDNNFPFMLKGSLLLAKYYPAPLARLALTEDIDFLYLAKAPDPMGAENNFRDVLAPYYQKINQELAALPWVKDSPLELYLDKNGEFDGESYPVDYQMEDDFLTAGSSLASCSEYPGLQNGWLDFDLEMTMNLPLFVSPQTIQYQPYSTLSPFIIPYAAKDEVQAGWKLHQCLVRPRIKDLVDLSYLLNGLDLKDELTLKQMLTTVVGECFLAEPARSKSALKNLFQHQLTTPVSQLIERFKQLLKGDMSWLEAELLSRQDRYLYNQHQKEAEAMRSFIQTRTGSLLTDIILQFKDSILNNLDFQRCLEIINELAQNPPNTIDYKTMKQY